MSLVFVIRIQGDFFGEPDRGIKPVLLYRKIASYKVTLEKVATNLN